MDVTPLELTDLMVGLPAGCFFWQSFGGPLAWSENQYLLAQIDFSIRNLHYALGGGKGKRPERMEPPKYASEQAIEADIAARKAERWAARHNS